MTRLEVTISPARPEDFGSRGLTAVDTLVLHTTEGGSVEGALAHWDRADVVASAHYVIDGRRVVQRVPEGMSAFHAGNKAVNRRSIGVEVVGHAGRRSTWTPEVLAQLVALAADIVERHRIPVLHGCPGILGHCDVPDPLHPGLRGGASHHTDPGAFFPWLDFLDGLRAELADDALEAAHVPPARPVTRNGDPA